MEVMEDGNLMDKVHILIQRDMEYYKVNKGFKCNISFLGIWINIGAVNLYKNLG